MLAIPSAGLLSDDARIATMRPSAPASVLLLLAACVDAAPGWRVPMEARAQLTLERAPCATPPSSCDGVESATIDLGATSTIARVCESDGARRRFVERKRVLTEEEQTRLRVVLALLRYDDGPADIATGSATLAVVGPEASRTYVARACATTTGSRLVSGLPELEGLFADLARRPPD